jgi:hypothetical protein
MSEFLNSVLLENGYDALSLSDKNVIIATIANEFGVEYNKVTDDHILNYHKNFKIAVLKSQCEADIENGFTAFNGHFYRTNRDDQINMIGQKGELDDDPSITEVPWKTEDADYIMHTREDWIKIYKEAFLTIRKKTLKYGQLKRDVKNVQSHPEIVEVKW